MLRNLGKKISMVLLCTSLVGFNAVPAFASTNVSSNIKANTSATVSNVLVDGSSSTQNISGGVMGAFYLTVNDNDLRSLVISCSVPVKTIIVPNSSALQNFIRFDSGEYRMYNVIGRHFLAGTPYTVLVTPQSTADVTVSLSKSSSVLTWVNADITRAGNTLSEQNMLMGGQAENYGVAFNEIGAYNVTVTTVAKSLTVTFGTEVKQIGTSWSSSICSFSTLYISAKDGTDQSKHVVTLQSLDPVNSGAAYTVTITRIN